MSTAVIKTAQLVLAPDWLPLDFVDFKSGKDPMPADTLMNALIAIHKLGLDCSRNEFKSENLIGGHAILPGEGIGEVSDLSVLALRPLIRREFGFEPSPIHMQHAVERACSMRMFHPIKNYLGSLEWDLEPRAGLLLPKYFNAPDTPFTRAASRCIVMASVRRIHKPGSKYDYITVLESDEGFNKSSAIEALYGKENYSDTSTLHMDQRQTEEANRGVWGKENGELQGLGKADWNKMKANLSRTNDRGRRAFDRNPSQAPRTVIEWGTSNDRTYLRANSGENRRFFPIEVRGMIDVEAIERDRDQIWAEAVVMESQTDERGRPVSILLPEKHWAAASEERKSRTEDDPWEDALANIEETAARAVKAAAELVSAGDDDGDARPFYDVVDGEVRVASWYLLEQVGIKMDKAMPGHGTRIRAIMQKLGWTYKSSGTRIRRRNEKGYTRSALYGVE